MTESFTERVGGKSRYGFDWTDYLADGATVASSVWTVTPPTGLALSVEDISSPQTSVMVEAITAGAYRILNKATMSDSSIGYQELLIAVSDPAAVPVGAYLSPAQIEARLWATFEIEASVSVADAIVASKELDAMRPFIGSRYSTDPDVQTLQFPRDIEPNATEGSGEVPEAILDAVTLLAYTFASDEGPPVKEEAAGGVSVSYALPKISITQRRIIELVRPYQVNRGQVGSARIALQDLGWR